MTLDGNTVPILWGYKPLTKLAIKWGQVASGNWLGSDRTSAEDTYSASVRFRGTFAELTTLDSVLTDTREAFNITCGDGEEIFGADFDYSGTISSTITKYGKMQRVGVSLYEISLELRALANAFATVTSSLDGLILGHKYTATSSYDLNKQFTYDGTADYQDHGTDPGIFEAVFLQTDAEAAAIRKYIRTTARAVSFTFPSIADYPFGPDKGVGPFTVKLIDWDDLGRDNLKYWRLRLKFARVF